MNKKNLEETKKSTGILNDPNYAESKTAKQSNESLTDFTDKITSGLTNADVTNAAIMNTDVESKTATQLNNSSIEFTDFTDKKTGGLTNADLTNVSVMNTDVESKSGK